MSGKIVKVKKLFGIEIKFIYKKRKVIREIKNYKKK